MAKYKPLIIDLEGKIGDISLYNSKFGRIARRKGGASRERISKDRCFERTRENNREFGKASTASKMLRRTVRYLSHDVANGTEAFRLTSVFLKIAHFDLENERGQRLPEVGLYSVEGRLLLEGFSFNGNSIRHVLHLPIEALPNRLTIRSLEPLRDLRKPEGASHVCFTAGIAHIGFEMGRTSLALSKAVVLDIHTFAGDVALDIDPPSADALLTQIYLLKVEFMQEINGKLYPLQDENAGVLEIVKVTQNGS